MGCYWGGCLFELIVGCVDLMLLTFCVSCLGALLVCG